MAWCRKLVVLRLRWLGINDFCEKIRVLPRNESYIVALSQKGTVDAELAVH